QHVPAGEAGELAEGAVGGEVRGERDERVHRCAHRPIGTRGITRARPGAQRMAASTRQRRGYIHTAKPQTGWRIITREKLVVATGGALSGAGAYTHETTRRVSDQDIGQAQSGPIVLAVDLAPCDSVQLK